MEAINPKNTKAFNKAVKYLTKYNELNDLRSAAEDADDVKTFRQLDRKCSAAFDKYLEACDELPKYEIARIDEYLY